MKVLLILILACSLPPRTFAQSPAAAPPPNARPAQSPELAEAERLSATVIELYKAGKFEEALLPASRVVAISEKVLGPSAAPVADALANLGVLQIALRKNDRARESYERALSIYEATLGPEAPTTVNMRNALAWHYYWTGSYDKAEAGFRRAHEARERAHGAAHPLAVDSLSGLAAVYLAKGKGPEREESFLRLIDAVEKLQGPVPRGLNKLFLTYGCTGAGRSGASARQKEVLERISAVRKRKGTEGGSGVVDGEVLNGIAISKPAPEYPAEAKYQRVSGTVIVYIMVDEAGRVEEAEAICGPPLLRESSVRAARLARFTPTLVDGKPVKVTGTITYNYNLM